MKIPFNDPLRQYLSLKSEIDQAVARILASGWYLLGDETSAFENEFANYCGAKHCISVANGTDALELALRLSVPGAGCEVITVANAGGYTTVACRQVDAVPVYVDVTTSTLLLDVRAALEAVTTETCAIVATHLYGSMVDVRSLRIGLADMGREDILLIEDCAQAHGAKLNGERAGSIGDIATFSFYPTKNLSAQGDAGAILCNRDDFADTLTRLRQYGWERKYHLVTQYGRNSRIDEIQAGILRIKLPHLSAWNARRRQILKRYRAIAPPWLQMIESSSEDYVGHLAVACSPSRDRVMQQLAALGIMTAVHYPVLDCDQPAMRGRSCVLHALPHSRLAAKHLFSLPCFPELHDVEVDYVCECLKKVVI